MEFKTYMENLFNKGVPDTAEKDSSLKKDKDREPVAGKSQSDPPRDSVKSGTYKWTKVNNWSEVLEKIK